MVRLSVGNTAWSLVSSPWTVARTVVRQHDTAKQSNLEHLQHWVASYYNAPCYAHAPCIVHPTCGLSQSGSSVSKHGMFTSGPPDESIPAAHAGLEPQHTYAVYTQHLITHSHLIASG